MNSTVKDWICKAESDFRVAGRELKATGKPSWDAVCFHSQQCAEKLFKAVLLQYGVIPLRTHDLAQLGQLLSKTCLLWVWNEEDLRFLTACSVAYRYPGETADRRDAERAFEICRHMRRSLRKLLQAG